MYVIENKEKYLIYCRPKYWKWQNLNNRIHGRPQKNNIPTEPTLEFICYDFSDALRYFANHYSHYLSFDWLWGCIDELYFYLPYIKACYMIDQFGRIIYPSMYKREVQKMVDADDLTYVGNTIDPKRHSLTFAQKQWLRQHSYVFRKDPIPYTGYRKQFFKSCYIRSVKTYNDTLDIDGMNEELEEMEIDFYLPKQKKKERKSEKMYDYKYRHCDRSWKSNTKCKKQWMIHERKYGD